MSDWLHVHIFLRFHGKRLGTNLLLIDDRHFEMADMPRLGFHLTNDDHKRLYYPFNSADKRTRDINHADYNRIVSLQDDIPRGSEGSLAQRDIIVTPQDCTVIYEGSLRSLRLEDSERITAYVDRLLNEYPYFAEARIVLNEEKLIHLHNGKEG